jgi:hypothetical protein
MLSKVTNREQEVGVTPIEREIDPTELVDVIHSLSQMTTPKRLEPGPCDPGRNGRVNGGKLRWD